MFCSNEIHWCPLEGQIAEPQEMVLKEQEGRAGGIQAMARGLDGNHPRDPWNALFVFSLLKYRLLRHMSGMRQTLKGQVNIQTKAHVWGMPNTKGTGKHLDSRQISHENYKFLSLERLLCLLSDLYLFACVRVLQGSPSVENMNDPIHVLWVLKKSRTSYGLIDFSFFETTTVLQEFLCKF